MFRGSDGASSGTLAERLERHAMTDMSIRDQWHRLPSTVTHWLMDNPGCVILPRTLSAEISAATSQPLNEDPHGETTLSQQDIDFIRMKSREAEVGQPDPSYTFFDAVQP
jgi:hypothetical protein